MEKEYLIKKYSDQKEAKEYSFYRTLKEENCKITNDSFDQFKDLESDDKSLAFFVTDNEIIYLSYTSSRKFFKTYLKTYRDMVYDKKIYKVYLDIKDNNLLNKLCDEGLILFNTFMLEKKENKTR